jgi:hypothetical protein
MWVDRFQSKALLKVTDMCFPHMMTHIVFQGDSLVRSPSTTRKSSSEADASEPRDQEMQPLMKTDSGDLSTDLNSGSPAGRRLSQVLMGSRHPETSIMKKI